MNITLGPDDTQVSRMRAVVLTEIVSERRTSRRRHFLTAGAIAFVAVLGTTAAAIIVAQAPTDARNHSADCYAVADVNATHGTTMLVDTDRDRSTLLPLAQRINNAIDSCEAAWHAVPTDPKLKPRNVDVPNPTVCQLRDDRLGVFPNRENASEDTFCERLGLHAPTH